MRSGCDLVAVWMQSGCGLDHWSLSKSVSDHYKMVSNTQSYKWTDGRTDGWDGMGWDGMGWDGWMDGWLSR